MNAREIYAIYNRALDDANKAMNARDDYVEKLDGMIDTADTVYPTLRSVAHYKLGFAEGIRSVYAEQFRIENEAK